MFGGFGSGGGAFGIPISGGGPEMAVEVALQMVSLMEAGRHREAVAIAKALREAVISLTVASALVTYVQDPEKPVIGTHSAESGEPQEPVTPTELLDILASGFPEEDWDRLTELFQDQVNTARMKIAAEKMPSGDLFVSDILGEKGEHYEGS